MLRVKSFRHLFLFGGKHEGIIQENTPIYHPNYPYVGCDPSLSLYFYVRLCAHVVHGADT